MIEMLEFPLLFGSEFLTSKRVVGKFSSFCELILANKIG
jgi:hypothetical protein